MSSIPLEPSRALVPTHNGNVVTIGTHGQTAKLRNPWAVAGLTLCTLGIYHLVWYYKVNREMCDYGDAKTTDLGYSAVTSLMAITLGGIAFGIPALVSIFHTGKRVMGAQRVSGIRGASAFVFLLLSVIPIVNLFAGTYLQAQLNQVWRTVS